MKKPIIALCYDFDKTLSPKDMQEYGFIDKLGMKPEEFWGKSNALTEKKGMEMILSCMYTMLQEAKKCNIDITKEELGNLGENIELFNGVDTWFSRINEIGMKNNVVVEHYIISSGLKEIIEGTSIAKYFKKIYASSFYYNENGKAVWPLQAVNFTTKTQYLYRINKNCEGNSVNDYMPDELRRIPFSNFVYIGDSETDIPCMKLIKSFNGNSIGVYNPKIENALKNIKKLIREGRINYYAECDYSENSQIENIITRIIEQISAKSHLLKIFIEQNENL